MVYIFILKVNSKNIILVFINVKYYSQISVFNLILVSQFFKKSFWLSIIQDIIT
jgi:hypothetical protein